MKGKLKLIVPIVVVLLVAAGGYKFAFAGEKPPKPKVHGDVYVLGKEFLVNLAGGRFAKLTVAIVHDAAADAGHGGEEAATPPEGFGNLPQEALVRGIVTDVVSGSPASALVRPKARNALQRRILVRIKHQTDVHATAVVFTDVTVQ